MHGHNVAGCNRCVRGATGYQFFQAQVLIQRVHLYFWLVPAATDCEQQLQEQPLQYDGV